MLRDRNADVAEHERMPSAVLKHLASQRGAGRFPVGAGDADKLRVAVAVAQLDFADDFDAALLCGAYERHRHRDNRADHHQRNAVKQRLGLFAEPPFGAYPGERFCKVWYLRLFVVDHNIPPGGSEQLCRADAAFCHADDQRFFALFHEICLQTKPDDMTGRTIFYTK